MLEEPEVMEPPKTPSAVSDMSRHRLRRQKKNQGRAKAKKRHLANLKDKGRLEAYKSTPRYAAKRARRAVRKVLRAKWRVEAENERDALKSDVRYRREIVVYHLMETIARFELWRANKIANCERLIATRRREDVRRALAEQ